MNLAFHKDIITFSLIWFVGHSVVAVGLFVLLTAAIDLSGIFQMTRRMAADLIPPSIRRLWALNIVEPL